MIARKCDRCGNFYETESDRSVVTSSTPDKPEREQFDLCPDCTTDFEIWIANKGSVVNKVVKKKK